MKTAEPQYADLAFPARGIDLDSPFGRPRPDTTPQGQNVRTFEPSTLRARGGSRPGLVRYIDQQLPLS